MENLLRPLWRVCFAKAKGGLPIDFDFYITARDIHSAAKFAEAWYESVGAGELLRDAQAEAAQIQNAKIKYDQGWITQEEAAEEITGNAPAEPAPRVAPAPMFSQPEPDVIPAEVDEEIANEEGEDRARLLAEVRAARLEVARVISAMDDKVSSNGHRVEA